MATQTREAVWNSGDGAKYTGKDDYTPNETITSGIVSEGVVDLSTGEEDEDHGWHKGVFQFCTKLKTVTLPESLRKIGENAFHKCEVLVHVDIPSGVNELGGGAFFRCKKLQTATIPEGVVDLPNSIFADCNSLKSVKLPSSLKSIGYGAFQMCSSLTAINFDALEGVTEISEQAFMHCSSLTTFKLPPSLKTIASSTFQDCKSLSEVELPASLETVKTAAFQDCAADLRIDLPEAVRNIHQWALDGRRISLPASLSILSNGGDVKYLLYRVKEVVMSSKVDLSLLVEHIHNLPDTYNARGKRIQTYDIYTHRTRPFLDPNLKFKVLYSGPSSAVASPPLTEHIPMSFFSFEASVEDLMSLHTDKGDDALLLKVDAAFASRLCIYASLLRCKTAELPEEILSDLLPFIYGDVLTNAMIGDIVSAVMKIR